MCIREIICQARASRSDLALFVMAGLDPRLSGLDFAKVGRGLDWPRFAPIEGPAGHGGEDPVPGIFAVMPAQAGLQRYARQRGNKDSCRRGRGSGWIPACAGMTAALNRTAVGLTRSSTRSGKAIPWPNWAEAETRGCPGQARARRGFLDQLSGISAPVPPRPRRPSRRCRPCACRVDGCRPCDSRPPAPSGRLFRSGRLPRGG